MREGDSVHQDVDRSQWWIQVFPGGEWMPYPNDGGAQPAGCALLLTDTDPNMDGFRLDRSSSGPNENTEEER